jgi:hypothetical protein
MTGLRETSTSDILWTEVSAGSFNLAIAEWEAIRTYMEEGLNPPLLHSSEEHEEGSVDFFHFCRRSYKSEHSFIRYIFGFLAIQFFSGWTLPCYISNWVNGRPKAGFPKAVQEWSKPLPVEQQAKPTKNSQQK